MADMKQRMINELKDYVQLFPGEIYYGPSYMKYGIDCLNTERAENLNDVMKLLEDKKHKETLEEEAKKQTRYARLSACYLSCKGLE